MEEKFNKIIEILNRLKTLQTDQIESFKQNAIPDLEMHDHEREKEFSKLKLALNLLLTTARQTKDKETADKMQPFCQRLIEEVLEQNSELKERIKAHRENLSCAMKQLSHGKKIIGYYANISSHGHNIPKVMNITR